MEDIIIQLIYDKIKDINFYNYNNEEELKNVDVKLYTNILNELVIDIVLEHKTYAITCFQSYADKEELEND